MPAVSHTNAQVALLALARQLTQASMTVALLQRTPDAMVPLHSEPPLGFQVGTAWRWQLPARQEEEGPGLQLLALSSLPSLLTTGLPFIPAAAAYLDCAAWGEQVAGGLLFLWDAADASHAAPLIGDQAPAAPPVLLLRPIYARLLDGRHLAVQTIESDAQFHDIFNSVPQGIVVVAGQGASAQVNQGASALLQISAGQVPADVLGQAMRTARKRCDNAAELELAYQPLQHALDAEVVVDWELNDRIWRVDTHPILDSGHNGRVWLFQDVTAQIQLERMLRREASHDALTGLFNRRAFFDRAQAHYQTQGPPHTPSADGAAPKHLALLIFDIDHFKQINDNFGHPAGDRVLKEVARRSKAALREGDVLARYGGEEFIVLLPQTSLAEARTAAERLRQAMQAQPVQVDASAIEVTISVGLALWRGAGETLVHTIERADGLLYSAKREGRNRVVDDAD